MKKILIVDDRPEVRELVEETLMIGDYQILKAENGETGVQLAFQEKPDLIIMDVMMPGELDGLEAVRKIKGDPETRHCVILMLTSKGKEDDIKKGYEAGADAYFTKPFSPLDLIQKVEEVLD